MFDRLRVSLPRLPLGAASDTERETAATPKGTYVTRRRVIIESFVVGVIIVAVIALTVTGLTGRAVERGLYATGLWVPVTGATTVAPTQFDEPTPIMADPASDLPPVLPAATAGVAPDADQVRAAIAGIDRSSIGGRIHASVIDLTTGEMLYSENADQPAIPASTMKVLTSVAVLKEYGPEHRFRTRVVLMDEPTATTPASPSASTPASPTPQTPTPASSTPPTIVLVGGGDPYLNTGELDDSYPAPTVGTLAKRTAEALRTQGVDTVSLGYDDTLFEGPAWNPTWPSNYTDQVTPVSALTVNQGRFTGESPGRRYSDPSGHAAGAFRDALEAEGITVTGDPNATPAPADSAEIAVLESLPLGEIVEHLMRVSDNDAAEIMFRHVAIAQDKPASFDGGRAAVAEAITTLSSWPAGTVIHDGSGLSRETTITTDTLARLMPVITTDESRYRSVMTGMPVGGVDGSLRLRFVVDGTTAGRGTVRAKTGTLRQVHSLAGYVRSADGALIGFAFVSNGADDEYLARTWLERASAAMAACGCN